MSIFKQKLPRGNKMLRVEAGKETVTSEDLDPMEVLRKKHIKEYLAEQAALKVANAPRDMGSTTQPGVAPGSIKIASSATIAGVTGDSDS